MNKCKWFGHKEFVIGTQYVPTLMYDGIKQVDRNVVWCKRCGLIYYHSPFGDYETINNNSYDWQPPIEHILNRNITILRSIKISNIKKKWKQNK